MFLCCNIVYRNKSIYLSNEMTPVLLQGVVWGIWHFFDSSSSFSVFIFTL